VAEEKVQQYCSFQFDLNGQAKEIQNFEIEGRKFSFLKITFAVMTVDCLS
jgi:hypothetical protein